MAYQQRQQQLFGRTYIERATLRQQTIANQVRENESMTKYEHTQGPYKKYSTNYTWKIQNWWLRPCQQIPQALDVVSRGFVINGMPGIMCHLSLSPASSGWNFRVELSNTQGIETMEVTANILDHFLHHSYNKPIPQIQTYQTENLDKNIPSSVPYQLCIVIEITIVKESDVLYRLYQPAALATIQAPNFVTPNNAAPNTAARNNTASNNGAPNIASELKTMYEQRTLCDVTFVVGDTTFNAHKIVLAARSNVFKAMFLSGMKEQKENIIDVADTEPEVFQEFLNYLYSGQVPELEKVVEQMIVIADFYDVSHLKIMCENVMLKSLSNDSVVRYVILADKHNVDTLKKRALKFIRNSAAVFEKALLEEDIATVICLKEILSNNQS